MTVWKDAQAVRRFGGSPRHAQAMARTDEWADETLIDRWRQDGPTMPDFSEAAARFGVAPPSTRLGVMRVLEPLGSLGPPVGSSRPDSSG